MTGPRIAVFAGPSGGHLFPALAYAEACKDRWPDSRLFLVSSRRAENFARHFEPGLFEEVIFLREFPFPSGFSLRSLKFLIEFPRAFMDSSKILSRIKPDFCAGFGSFVSYPGMRLAMWRKIPNLVHEQNVVPGKATKMLYSHAQLTAMTFENTFEKAGQGIMAVTGLPLRRVLRRAAEKKMSENQDKPFHVLVVGGSQGSRGLNKIISETFLRLSSEEKKNLAVTHITGKADLEQIREIYRANGIQAEVHAFYENMHELYGKADMAITRAGANTLFELALFKVPAIVVPYPYAGAHQAENSGYFEKRGALVQRTESLLTPDWLVEQVRYFQKHSEQRRLLAGNIAKLGGGDPAQELAAWTGKLLGESTLESHRQQLN